MRREINHSGFAQLLVEDGQVRTGVDLGSDARLFPVQEGPGFPLLSGEELAVDKLLALFGRSEARDFVDLMAVADRYGLDRLLDLAAEKDRGFDAKVLDEMLSKIDRLPRSAFPVDDTRYEALHVAVGTRQDRALVYAREQERVRGNCRDRGPDLGLGRKPRRRPLLERIRFPSTLARGALASTSADVEQKRVMLRCRCSSSDQLRDQLSELAETGVVEQPRPTTVTPEM